MKRIAALLLLAINAASCARTADKLGGESNWLTACATGDDCDRGTCLCGICSTNCTGDTDCDDQGGGLCVQADHPAIERSCGNDVSFAATCRAACDGDEECPGGQSCVQGMCFAPASNSRSETDDAAGDGGTAAAAATVSNPEVDAASESATDAVSERMGASSDAGWSPEGGVPDVPLADGTDSGFPAPTLECAFEYIGYLGCSGWDSNAVEGAAGLQECLELCEAQPNCLGIQDYSWLGANVAEYSDSTCYLQLGQTDGECETLEPFNTPGRTYGKRCESTPSNPETKTAAEWGVWFPAPGYTVEAEAECYFGVLPQNTVCERYGDLKLESNESDDLFACFAACDADPECTAVTGGIRVVDGSDLCVTFSGTCDAPRDTEDFVVQYVKVCEP